MIIIEVIVKSDETKLKNKKNKKKQKPKKTKKNQEVKNRPRSLGCDKAEEEGGREEVRVEEEDGGARVVICNGLVW